MVHTRRSRKSGHREGIEDLSPMQASRLSDLHPLVQRRLLMTFLRTQGMTLKEACTQLGLLSIRIKPNVAVKDLHQAGFDKWIITRFARELFKEELVKEISGRTYHEPWQGLEAELQKQSGSVL